MLLHIGVVRLDVDGHKVSPWHRLVPRTRVLCAGLVVFAIALTPNGRWLTWAVYAVALLSLVLLSRVTLPVLLRRLAVEMLFLGVVVLGALFRPGEDVLWQWGWLRVTSEGLMVLGSVALKGMLSLLMLNLLVITTSVPALLQALRELRMPALLVAILASMSRYIGVLLEEVTAMQRAAQSRNLMSHRRWQRLVIGNMIGALFLRTYDRGDRIHRAMLSRGYTGLIPVPNLPIPTRLDVVALTLMAVLLLLGQAIYLV
ncbi:MAG: cobalt ECF transporter T component CbiQ [Cyanobacteria bacterium J069]|nr:MAG: cobalt ECF transporter T component CbiQ [Cyanobacteria bacterium J069]